MRKSTKERTVLFATSFRDEIRTLRNIVEEENEKRIQRLTIELVVYFSGRLFALCNSVYVLGSLPKRHRETRQFFTGCLRESDSHGVVIDRPRVKDSVFLELFGPLITRLSSTGCG